MRVAWNPRRRQRAHLRTAIRLGIQQVAQAFNRESPVRLTPVHRCRDIEAAADFALSERVDVLCEVVEEVDPLVVGIW